MNVLEVSGVHKQFGGLVALDDVNFQVRKGSVTAVIGPNGAGKTTFFNLITGVYQPDRGDIRLEGKPLVGLRPDQVAMLGIARTFQNIRLFADLPVLDNVLVAMHGRLSARIPGILLGRRQIRQEERRAIGEAYWLLEYMGLAPYANEIAKNLPYGTQRRLEIARALATHPKLLLLDEPAAGMSPRETRELTEMIHRLREDFGLTVVLIEHDMKLVMNISEHILVLDYGRAIAEGPPEEIRNNPRVIEAYLGRGAVSGA
ncbi:ABC transporter ATP-binding protein [Alicyclobacillus macrosporangiidus]|uniref:Branched-chain amino acid transport system ATP-binding protein n=1 Tax=Alicyclobacillus macrosporangiidus TaxID=392015 RepID=A0A1I7H1M9_9BACL|nr:ABC transporter ATP-binding protein [Alicyclobacillus macrosporangiidus]SFU54609.1 branched-chain amino acid transport system ATP-binding protein [Alicyclobacillus macrosporangiidus]